MSESHPHTASASASTEAQSVALRPIIIFALILVALTGVALLGMRWLFTLTTTRQAQLDAPVSPMAQTASPLPPAPRLQVQPVQDLRQIRAEEDAVLQHYGWVNAENGVVRIPLERAMELVLERGLPQRTAEQPTPSTEQKGTP